jgi:flavodoxin
MKVVVVYESVWGNTAAIARAIAEGIGPEAPALSTAEASATVLTDTDLIVAGAPVHGFRLPTDGTRESIRKNPGKTSAPPDLSHPSLRSWLDALPKGHGRFAAFETRIWWSPRGATGTIARKLRRAGYDQVGKPHRFVVKGKDGPLRDGELERAREWGAELAKAMRSH